MDINQTITYRFPYAWNQENMSDVPKVNLLLKSLIERDYQQADMLLRQGASFKKIDEATFQRCLFEFMGDYRLIKFMIDKGFSGIDDHLNQYESYTNCTRCIDGLGYFWGLTGRAFALGKTDVLNLLFKNRFYAGQIWVGSKGYFLPRYAMKSDNIALIDLLLSHGYPKQKLLNELYADQRDNSKAYQYVASNPKINWKSYGLGELHKEIPIPQEPKISFFMLKRTKQALYNNYERALYNYNEEIKARKKYVETMPKDKLKYYYDELKFHERLDKEMEPIYDAILEEARKKTLEKYGN